MFPQIKQCYICQNIYMQLTSSQCFYVESQILITIMNTKPACNKNVIYPSLMTGFMSTESSLGPADRGDRPKCLIIYNPTAGRRRRRKLDAGMAKLRDMEISVALAETTGPGDSETMARDAEDGLTMIVVAAGDGTINGAVNGLMARAAAGRPVPPLGILPLGTANVLAGELGLPTQSEAAARVLATGRTARINLGRANGRYFSIMAGVGFDARVVERIDPSVKRLLGKGAYVLATLRELIELTPARFHVVADDAALDASAAVIASGHYYAGRFVLAPKASLVGSRLQICVFRRFGRWAVIRYLIAMALGLLPRLSDFMVVPAESATVTGIEGSPVQGDGDILAHLPLNAEIVPRAIEVIVPEASALAAG